MATAKQMEEKLDFNPMTGEEVQDNIPTEKEKYKHSKDYLAKIEVEITDGVKYDQETGKEISRTFVQTFTPTEFARFEKDARHLGYKYKVLYKPTK